MASAVERAWLAERAGGLQVAVWHDMIVERSGHDMRSVYVETFWTPVLGPSAVLMARRLAVYLATTGDPVTVDLVTLAGELGLGGHGLGESVSKNSPVVRTVARLCDFGVAAPAGNCLMMRTALPAVPLRHHKRIPAHLLEVMTRAA